MKDQYGYWMRAGGKFNEGMGYRGSGREKSNVDQGMQANGSKMSEEIGGDSEKHNEEKVGEGRNHGDSNGHKEGERPNHDSTSLEGSNTGSRTGLVGRYNRSVVAGIGEASEIVSMRSIERGREEIQRGGDTGKELVMREGTQGTENGNESGTMVIAEEGRELHL